MLTRRLLVPLAVAPFAVGALLTGTASAAPATAFSAGVTSAPDAAAVPAPVGITGKPAHYTKTKVTTKRTPSTASKCTPTNASLKVTNSSAASQTVTAGTQAVVTLKPKQIGYICATSAKPFTATLSLKSNAKAKLTVTFN